MGMFDTIRSSYDLGPGFWNKDLQTKDLDCTLSEYWISPNGELFEIDYSGTHDWELVDNINYKPVPNGNRGAVRPIIITTELEVYPSTWDAHYAKFPTMKITFIDGVLRK
jgi:hypothetical protein